MANDFYTHSGAIPLTLSRGSSALIRAEFDKIVQGFDRLPTVVMSFTSTQNYAADTGAANLPAVAISTSVTALVDGMEVVFKAAFANTGDANLTVTGSTSFGAKQIVRPNGDPLQANDYYAGQIVTVRYNATTQKWQYSQNAIAAALAAAASAAAASGSAAAASGSATAASGSATLASQWATTTGAQVAATDFSAKEYAIGDTVTAGSAKNWAQKVGAAVIAGLYSAKEWAVGTFTRGTAGGGSAKDWATYTGGTVDDTERSAKYYAALAAASAATLDTSNFATKTGAETLTNKTLSAPTVNGYTEGTNTPAAGSSFTVDLTKTVSAFTTNANATITIPAPVAGKAFQVQIDFGGAHSLTWSVTGGTSVKWPANTAPTPTSTSGKTDIFNFTCDAHGTGWCGAVFGQNYTT